MLKIKLHVTILDVLNIGDIIACVDIVTMLCWSLSVTLQKDLQISYSLLNLQLNAINIEDILYIRRNKDMFVCTNILTNATESNTQTFWHITITFSIEWCIHYFDIIPIVEINKHFISFLLIICFRNNQFLCI